MKKAGKKGRKDSERYVYLSLLVLLALTLAFFIFSSFPQNALASPGKNSLSNFFIALGVILIIVAIGGYVLFKAVVSGSEDTEIT